MMIGFCHPWRGSKGLGISPPIAHAMGYLLPSLQDLILECILII